MQIKTYPDHVSLSYDPVYAAIMKNDATRQLADISRWSVSGHTTDGKDKMPLDIFALKTYHQVQGCNQTLAGATDTLHALEHDFTLPNAAFFLEAQYDNYCLLDIEPTVSTDELRRLLSIDEILYAEWSLSGKGIHLLLPATQAVLDGPGLGKTVWKHKDKTYELHLSHWVTFTGNVIDVPSLGIDSNYHIDDFYRDLWQEQCLTTTADATLTDETLDLWREQPWHWTLVSSFHKALDEHFENDGTTSGEQTCQTKFKGDHSVYEFCLFRDVLRKVYNAVPANLGYDNSPDCLAYALYDALTYDEDDAIPMDELPTYALAPRPLGIIHNPAEPVLYDRDKFHTLRKGQPYLMWNISRIANQILPKSSLPNVMTLPSFDQNDVSSIAGVCRSILASTGYLCTQADETDNLTDNVYNVLLEALHVQKQDVTLTKEAVHDALKEIGAIEDID